MEYSFVIAMFIILLLSGLYVAMLLMQQRMVSHATSRAIMHLPPYIRNRGSFVKAVDLRQYMFIGQLVSADVGEQTLVLPLFGRRIPNCSRWEYFTRMNQYMIPVVYENKDCSVKYVGCNQIQSGARVTVPEYAGKVFLFKSIRY